MEYPIKFAQLSHDGPLYIIIIYKTIIYLSLKINFVLTNSAGPDEIPDDAAFHQGLHCLPKYPFRGFWYTKVICSLVIRAVFYISTLHVL